MKFRIVTPDTDKQWHGLRQKGIGGSDSPAILGEDRYRSALDVYCDKLGIADVLDDEEPDPDSAREFGRDFEKYALMYFADRFGLDIVHNRSVYISTRYPWLRCTPDGVDRGNPVPNQVKLAGTRDGWEDGQIPNKHYVQVQHELLVMDQPMGRILAVTGGRGGQKPFAREVVADRALQDRILNETGELWDRVQRQDPPQPDGSDASQRALKRLYGRESDGAIVELSPATVEASDELAGIEATLGELGKRRALLRQLIQAELQDAAYGLLPDGAGWSWRTVRKEAHVVKATEYRMLRRVVRKTMEKLQK